jgi:SAM-dependent methyltransferase
MQKDDPMHPLQEPEASAQPTHAGFYRALEDRFRGSRELILSRLAAYLPFIEPLKGLAEIVSAVDLGCGRGEWLELLKQHGFEGQGVDVDAGMLHACRERGLQVTEGDAIDFLKALPSESQLIVSGFHVAEHLSFETLQTLIQQALRVLKPAGLLILETPNPENFKVSSLYFYLDPSHRNPLPPDLLAFVPEYYGFARVKIVRLQEDDSLMQVTSVSLDQVFGGASPDYAVVAQKGADTQSLEVFSGVFQRDFGLSSATLLQHYDSVHHGDEYRGVRMAEDARRIAELGQTVSFLSAENERREEALVGLRGHLQEREVAWAAFEQEHHGLSESHRYLTEEHHHLTEEHHRLTKEVGVLREHEASLDQELIMLRTELDTLYRSKSWRITAPFRFVVRRVRKLLAFCRRLAYVVLRYTMRRARPLLRVVARWNWLRWLTLKMVGRNSRLAARARTFLFGPSPLPAMPVISEASLTREAAQVLSVINSVRKDMRSNGMSQAPREG